MELKRVVVTGIGSLTPVGNDVPSMWKSLLDGVSGADVITYFDTEKFKCHIASELKGYDPLAYFDRKEVNRLDRFGQYAIVSTDEAIADSGIFDGPIDKERVAVIWGSGFGGVKTFQNESIDFCKGGYVPRFSPFFVPKTITNICSGIISIRYGLKGPNYAVTAACASSAVALGEAFDLIRLGKAVAAIAGGSEAAIAESGIGAFSSMQALSTRNDDPKTASRPFDADRDGFVLGEGSATLILEELEHAKARGAKIYAELTGWGATADAHHITAPHPEGTGAAAAMRLAVEESEMRLEDVVHINTHGTSTPQGDIAEPKAVAALFGEHAKKISLNSTKSMTGHLLGAAGALEAAITVLSIKNDIIPPTINHFTDDPRIEPLDFTFNAARQREIPFALSNAFGFGGHNVSLAFRKWS
ncbi:MAG: beta-ketoacyl-ACP synthase II [Bacteroidales bacterium]|nr:beta-ketoacyl-ACP synthase II [Bacteroidales bacterium]